MGWFFENRVKPEQKTKKMSGFATGVRIALHKELLFKSNR